MSRASSCKHFKIKKNLQLGTESSFSPSSSSLFFSIGSGRAGGGDQLAQNINACEERDTLGFKLLKSLPPLKQGSNKQNTVRRLVCCIAHIPGSL